MGQIRVSKWARPEYQTHQAFLLEAQRLSQTGSWKHDLASGLVTFTPEVARIFAFDPTLNAVPAQFFFERIHPEDREAEAANYGRAISTKSDLRSEYRICLPDGSIKHVYNTGHPEMTDEGEIAGYVGTAMDVTEQSQATAKLESALGEIRHLTERLKAENLALGEREHELNLIVETIPGLIWCAAPAGEVTYVNRQVLEYCGASRESFTANGWADFLHPDDLAVTLSLWARAVEREEPHEMQYRVRRFDGEYRWFQVVGHPARNPQGQVIRWYGLLIDIHDRKCAEETMRQAEGRLARATQLAAVGELSASIAHEVNQPLAAVVANAHAALRWLSAEPPNIARAVEAAERILRDGKEASAIVQRIRSLFGRGSVEKVSVEINSVIAEVLTVLQTETMRKGVRIETMLADDLPTLEGDRVQLQQLVLNLALNGIEAMDGILSRPKTLTVSSARSDAGVVVSVEDCGAGLPEGDKMFESFFTTKPEGMGMGLAISSSIAEAHGGKLWAEPGQTYGAVFRFVLPVKP